MQARRPFPASPQILVSPQSLDVLPYPAALPVHLDLPAQTASDASDAVPLDLPDLLDRCPFPAAVLVLQVHRPVPRLVSDRKSAVPAEFHPARPVRPLQWALPVVAVVAEAAHCKPAADPSAA
jgi:hypothetical protein